MAGVTFQGTPFAKQAQEGRFGDNQLVHVGPREIQMLLRAGGAGTRNPKTGLLEFYGAGAGADEGGPGSMAGEGGASSDADSAGHGGNYGGRGGSDSGGGGSPMGGASGDYNSTSQLARRDPITNAALQNQSMKPENGWGTGWGPGIGAWLGHNLLGLGYMDPTKMNQHALATGKVPSTVPDTGIDVVSDVLGLAGGFVAPGVGTALTQGLSLAKNLGIVPGEFGMIDLGNWGGTPTVSSGKPTAPSVQSGKAPTLSGQGRAGGGPALGSGRASVGGGNR